jgi:hypothetical protein
MRSVYVGFTGIDVSLYHFSKIQVSCVPENRSREVAAVFYGSDPCMSFQLAAITGFKNPAGTLPFSLSGNLHTRRGYSVTKRKKVCLPHGIVICEGEEASLQGGEGFWY